MMTAAVHPTISTTITTANDMANLHHSPHPDDVTYEVAYDDFMKLTPVATPLPEHDMEPPYRCPVSTPANFVHPSPRVRRTKPMPVSLEINLTPSSPGKRSAGGKPPRPGAATHRSHSQMSGGSKFLNSSGGGGGGGGRLSRGLLPAGVNKVNGGGLATGTLNSRTLDYYYVDKAEEQREAAETNTFWLKALCSQPVTEILDKYRRRSDLRRTRLIWSRTYTTPGERSLLQAWERNGPPMFGVPAGALQGFRIPTGQRLGCNRGSVAAQSQSVKEGRSKTGSAVGSGVLPSPRYHQSEPFHRSRDYPSDEGEDDTEDEDTRMGSSTVSADVSVSTPRYSQRQQSPCLRSPCSMEYKGQRQCSRERKAVSEQSEELTDNSHHPAEPAYDMSDHFQVSLPKVTEKRGRAGRERLGMPKTKNTSFPRDRRRPLRDHRADVITSQLSEASTPASTLPPDTPRSDALQTILPAIV